MVVGLGLETGGLDCSREIGAEETHGVELVGIGLDSEPGDVKVVWHEDVGWAEKVFANAGVQKKFANCGVEFGCERKFGTVERCNCPEDGGVGLVTGRIEARQGMGKVCFGIDGHEAVVAN